ncbi:MAG: hypothetical protein E7016_07165 [Alphaproteobacteria bacterium]|nr:hypothetical protein [Alphaproteobacteria bacterium]
MIKYILAIIVLMLIVGLVTGGVHLYKVGQKNKKDLASYINGEIKYNNNLGKTLVVYYSLSGNTESIAQNIAQKTNADVFKIETKEQIKQNPSFYLKIKKQLSEKKYPELNAEMPDFANYDTIFVGFPVWWYTIATPVLSFLQQADFAGKKVVPFSTQGSNYGTSFTDFKANAKNAQISEGQAFNNLDKKYDKAVDNKINNWLNGL